MRPATAAALDELLATELLDELAGAELVLLATELTGVGGGVELPPPPPPPPQATSSELKVMKLRYLAVFVLGILVFSIGRSIRYY